MNLAALLNLNSQPLVAAALNSLPGCVQYSYLVITRYAIDNSFHLSNFFYVYENGI